MTTTATAVSAVLRIPLAQLRPGPNARGPLGDVTELAQSLLNLGQQEPILVTDTGNGDWQVLDGHRRLAAAHLAGLLHLDAVVRRDHGPARRLLQQLAMHAQRQAFDPIAEGRVCHTLMWEHNLSCEQIAAAAGKSTAWVRDRIALTYLRPDEQDAVAAGRMTLVQAKGIIAQRRAERDQRPAPANGRHPVTTAVAPRPHCPTCRCPGRGEAA